MNNFQANFKFVLALLGAGVVAAEPMINNGNFDLKRDWYKFLFAAIIGMYGAIQAKEKPLNQ